jgi:hypothetical protein
MNLLSTCRKLFALPSGRKRLLFQATALTLAARAMLPVARLRRTRAAMGVLARLAPSGAAPEANASRTEIEWAFRAVLSRMGGTCLMNALAAEALFAQHGHPVLLRIGVAHESGGFAAHAWLEQDGEIVVGGPASVVEQYTAFSRLDNLTI